MRAASSEELKKDMSARQILEAATRKEKRKKIQVIDPDCKSTLQPENTNDEPHIFLESEF